MTYDEFLNELAKSGLTIRAFAQLMRMNRNSVSNYARHGEIPGHLAVIAALIGEMNMHGVDYRAVLARVNLEPKKPRGSAKPGRFGGDRQDELELEL